MITNITHETDICLERCLLSETSNPIIGGITLDWVSFVKVLKFISCTHVCMSSDYSTLFVAFLLYLSTRNYTYIIVNIINRTVISGNLRSAVLADIIVYSYVFTLYNTYAIHEIADIVVYWYIYIGIAFRVRFRYITLWYTCTSNSVFKVEFRIGDHISFIQERRIYTSRIQTWNMFLSPRHVSNLHMDFVSGTHNTYIYL